MTTQEILKDIREVTNCKISDNGDVTFCRTKHDYMDEGDNFIIATACKIKKDCKKIQSFKSMIEFEPGSKRDMI